MNALKLLFRSRKFLVALLAVIQTLVSHYAGLPPEIWASIDAVLVVVISTIAIEDAAEKRAAGTDVGKRRM